MLVSMQRLIVEFAVENSRALNLRAQRKQRQVGVISSGCGQQWVWSVVGVVSSGCGQQWCRLYDS